MNRTLFEVDLSQPSTNMTVVDIEDGPFGKPATVLRTTLVAAASRAQIFPQLRIPIDPDATYQVMACYRVIEPATTGGSTIYVGVSKRGEDGTPAGGNYGYYYTSEPQANPSGEWVTIQGSVTGTRLSVPMSGYPTPDHAWPLFFYNYTNGNSRIEIGYLAVKAAGGAFPVSVLAKDQMTLQRLQSVEGTTPYFLKQASTLPAPSVPTTNPPTGGWTTEEPTYTEGSTDTLYVCWLTTYGSTFEWSTVSKSASFEAAKQAFNKAAATATVAANLQAAVDGGLMKVAKASAPPEVKKGLIWAVLDEESGSVVVGLRVANSAGTAWGVYQLLAEDILVVGSNGQIRLKDGVVAANNLLVDAAFAKMLAAERLLVSGRNLLPDPNFSKAVFWANTTYTMMGGTVTVPASATQVGVTTPLGGTDVGLDCPVEVGATYALSVRVKSTAAISVASRIAIICRWYTNTGALITTSTFNNPATWTAGANAETEYAVVTDAAPAGAAWMSFGVYANATHNSQVVFSVPKVIPRNSGVLMEDGIVSAEKLAAQIVLMSELIAGPVEGTHVRLNQTGLHVYRPLVTGGVAEVISLGSDGSPDYLTISDGAGDPLATINDVGSASFQELSTAFNADLAGLLVDGEAPSEFVPRNGAHVLGSVSFGPGDWGVSWAGDRFINNAGWKRVLEVDWTNETGTDRVLWIPTVAFTIRTSASGVTGATWGWTLNGAAPSANVPAAHDYTTFTAAGYVPVSAAQRLIKVPSGARFRARLDVYNSGFEWTFFSPTTLTLWDLGPVGDYADAQIIPSDLTIVGGTNKSSSQGASKTAFDKTFTANWYRAFYDVSGAYNSGMAGKASQGSWTGAAAQRMKGMIGFPDLTAALSGVDISKIMVYLYMDHWWQNSGGVADVGVHGSLNAPSTLSGGSSLITLKTGKAAGAWGQLPTSTHAGFKSGANRGILLKTSSNDTSKYGWTTRLVKLRIIGTK